MSTAIRRQWLRGDPLAFAVAVSLALHAALMFVHFAPPVPVRFKPEDTRLEVVLVNARSPGRPVAPDVLAQVDQEGGGDRDAGRRRSPLPIHAEARDGDALQARRRQLEQLEARQQELLALARGPQAFLPPDRRSPEPARHEGGPDRDDADALMSRLQGEIARNIDEYNRRPKRLTYGVNAVGVHYARYVSDWAARVEQIGTSRFPPEARGRQYDSLVITVEIDRHGNVVDVILNRKSRYEALNRAVRQIVHAGQPYERFPPEMARDGDILQIVRTWTFTNDALETRSIRSDR
jgi:periplasmic protein TonB